MCYCSFSLQDITVALAVGFLGLVIVSAQSPLSRLGRGRSLAGSVRRHSLSSSPTTKEHTHFVTSFCSSPSSESGHNGRVAYRLSHLPEEDREAPGEMPTDWPGWQTRLRSGTQQHFGQLGLFTRSSGPTNDRQQRSLNSY